MRKVDSLQILGNPNRIDRQVACPECSARAMAFEDGSVMCIVENKCFAPEPSDRELFEMRRRWDEKLGITPGFRLTVPASLRRGIDGK